MRAVVTGFDAFGGGAFNPSEEVVDALRRAPPPGVAALETAVLPTAFGAVDAWVAAQTPRLDADVILMLGLSGRAARLTLERFALNIVDCGVADNAGASARGAAICEDAPPALRTRLDLEAIAADLSAAGAPVVVSNNAGEYVCNYLYFRVLDALRRRGARADALFVHLPWTLAVETREDFGRSPRERLVWRVSQLLGVLQNRAAAASSHRDTRLPFTPKSE